ncbi:hypothetical protein AB7C87_01690 [Natrarchaeobius sp. A-rgal3]|uniref:hypothetical protein n=1 Tax=Natrarchaeobius versutus TaxID=1679078 RepID=UPI00350F8008
MPLSEFREELEAIDRQLVEAIGRRVERQSQSSVDRSTVDERVRDGARDRGLAVDDVSRIFERLDEAGQGSE